MEKKKMIILNLGCVGEYAIIDKCKKFMEENNIEMTDKIEEADYVLLNTCGGTGEIIKRDEKKWYYNLISLVNFDDFHYHLFLTGCLAVEGYFDCWKDTDGKFIKDYDNISIIKKRNFVEPVFNFINNEHKRSTIRKKLDDRCLDWNKNNTVLLFQPVRGCPNKCSFCKTHYYDHYQKVESLDFDACLNYLKEKVRNGCVHLTFGGDNLTLYGIDLYSKQRLHDLIHEISKEPGLISIQLNEIVPGNMYKELEEEILNNPKVTGVMMQLETASDRLLKLMNRNYTLKEYDHYAKEFSDRGIYLSTVIMSGFPTETDEDIKTTIDYLNKRNIKIDTICEYDDFEYIPSHELEQYSRKEKREHTKKFSEFKKVHNLRILNDLGQNDLNFVLVNKKPGCAIFESDFHERGISIKKKDLDLNLGDCITRKPSKVLTKSKFIPCNIYRL